ncbi:MAG: hypothetical protein WD398_16060 [Cyclobacteriaceae bacterium]
MSGFFKGFLIILYVLALMLLPLTFSYGQTYTSNGNCDDWGDGACWTKVDDGSGCTNNTSLSPPSNPLTNCPINVVINHPMTYASGLTFGGSFQAITFGTSGSLSISNSITLSNNYTLNVYGDALDQEDFFKVSGLTLGAASKLVVDAHAKMLITGITQFTNQNGWIKVDGYFQTGSIATTGNSSLTLEVDQDATVIVDLDIDMNGNSKLTFVGNGSDPEYINDPDNSRSVVDIRGKVKTNGIGAELVADNITVFVCNGIDTRVSTSEPNTGKFETQCLSALPVKWAGLNLFYNKNTRSVQIDWSTFREWENSHFVVERGVGDLKKFQNIGTVEAVGWSSDITRYRFTDDNLPVNEDRIYYRICQIDFNSAFTYSEVMSISAPLLLSQEMEWLIFPNPTKGGNVYLKLLGGHDLMKDEKLILRLLSPHQTPFPPLELRPVPSKVWNINSLVQSVSEGFYLLEISYGNLKYHLKFIK